MHELESYRIPCKHHHKAQHRKNARHVKHTTQIINTKAIKLSNMAHTHACNMRSLLLLTLWNMRAENPTKVVGSKEHSF